MNPHHAVIRELAYDRQALLLSEAQVDERVARLEAERRAEQPIDIVVPEAGILSAWLMRRRSAKLRPVLRAT